MHNKSIAEIVGVWVAYLLGWLFNLFGQISMNDWLAGVTFIKEILAALGFLAALVYTLMKIRREKKKEDSETIRRGGQNDNDNNKE